jgi:DNA gyrase subunit B
MLIEKGHIYIAQPPLFKVKRGKQEEYVQTEEQMNEMLLNFGCEGVSLKTNGAKGQIEGPELKEILKLIQAMEDLTGSLARKGISADQYIKAHDKKKGFPVYHFRVPGEGLEMFLYSDAERKENQKKYAAKAVTEAPQPEEGEEGAPAAPEELYEEVEIPEAAEYDKIVKRFAKFGLEIEDYVGGEENKFLVARKGKKETEYHDAKSLEAVLRYVKKSGKDGINVQRYKGLGEMNPTQLWETTMDPARRTVLRVTLEDAVEADEIFTVLMGDQVEPRRKFIERHAKAVRNLEI